MGCPQFGGRRADFPRDDRVHPHVVARLVGIGAAIDVEDQVKGFGMHSDQERLLESELHRFVRFNWEIVTALARAQ